MQISNSISNALSMNEIFVINTETSYTEYDLSELVSKKVLFISSIESFVCNNACSLIIEKIKEHNCMIEEINIDAPDKDAHQYLVPLFNLLSKTTIKGLCISSFTFDHTNASIFAEGVSASALTCLALPGCIFAASVSVKDFDGLCEAISYSKIVALEMARVPSMTRQYCRMIVNKMQRMVIFYDSKHFTESLFSIIYLSELTHLHIEFKDNSENLIVALLKLLVRTHTNVRYLDIECTGVNKNFYILNADLLVKSSLEHINIMNRNPIKKECTESAYAKRFDLAMKLFRVNSTLMDVVRINSVDFPAERFDISEFFKRNAQRNILSPNPNAQMHRNKINII